VLLRVYSVVIVVRKSDEYNFNISQHGYATGIAYWFGNLPELEVSHSDVRVAYSMSSRTACNNWQVYILMRVVNVLSLKYLPKSRWRFMYSHFHLAFIPTLFLVTALYAVPIWWNKMPYITKNQPYPTKIMWPNAYHNRYKRRTDKSSLRKCVLLFVATLLNLRQ